MKRFLAAVLMMVLACAAGLHEASAVPYQREAGARPLLENGVCRAWVYYDSDGTVRHIDVVYDANVADYGSADTTGSIAYALSRCTSVRLASPGATYPIQTTLVLRSDTTLDLNGATIQQSASNHKISIVTAAYSQYRDITDYTGRQAVAVTAIGIDTMTASGRVVTVNTSVAHGFSSGDWVVINQAGQRWYNGCYQVTVSDADTFTYTAIQAPDETTASAGTEADTGMVCVPAVKNVVVKNGTIDHNNNGTTAHMGSMAMVAYGMVNSRFENLIILNAIKYGIYPAAIRDCTFRNLRFETPSDGLHISGPAHNVFVDNVTGTAGDDGVAIIPQEIAIGAAYWTAVGDVQGVIVDGVNIKADTTASVALYNFGSDRAEWEASHNYAVGDEVEPVTANGYAYKAVADSGSSGGSAPSWPTTLDETVSDSGITWRCIPKSKFAVRGVVLKNIRGNSENSIIKLLGNSDNRSFFEDIVIDGVLANPDTDVYCLFSDYASLNSLDVHNVTIGLEQYSSGSGGIQLQNGNIKQLKIANLKDVSGRKKTTAFGIIGLTGIVSDKIILRDFDCYYTTDEKVAQIVAIGSGNIREIVLDGIKIWTGSKILIVESAATVGLVTANNILSHYVDALFIFNSSAVIHFSGIHATADWAGMYVVRSIGAGTTVRMHGEYPVLVTQSFFEESDGGSILKESPSLAAASFTGGDILYYGADGWTVLAKGTEGHILKMGASYPAWSAP